MKVSVKYIYRQLLKEPLVKGNLATKDVAFKYLYTLPPPVVGKVPVYRAGGSGSIPCWTNTQGLKIIEEKRLP